MYWVLEYEGRIKLFAYNHAPSVRTEFLQATSKLTGGGTLASCGFSCDLC